MARLAAAARAADVVVASIFVPPTQFAPVCPKLFLQTGADFREKGWQQRQVVRRAVPDLDIPIPILPVPTVREADGMALSSRNRFLASDQRARAPLLHAAPTLRREGAAVHRDGFATDDLAPMDAKTMRPMGRAASGLALRIVAAARRGRVRRLDNLAVA